MASSSNTPFADGMPSTHPAPSPGFSGLFERYPGPRIVGGGPTVSTLDRKLDSIMETQQEHTQMLVQSLEQTRNIHDNIEKLKAENAKGNRIEERMQDFLALGMGAAEALQMAEADVAKEDELAAVAETTRRAAAQDEDAQRVATRVVEELTQRHVAVTWTRSAPGRSAPGPPITG